jgi:hypothetical protein
MAHALLTRSGRRLSVLLCALLAVTALPIVVAPASADDHVEITRPSNIEDCNGVTSTPGSQNTLKNITGGDLQPGGTVRFTISYPTADVPTGEFFELTDCFVVQDDRDRITRELDKFIIKFTPNDRDLSFTYNLQIPSDLPLGTEVCNYVKTTQAPSAAQSSNRKGGICFTVGGTLRVEKRDAVSDDLVEGATFTVACVPTVAFPTVVISGLQDARPTGAPATGTNTVSGYANTGVIAINGPEGTSCTVTETEAPPGYLLPANPVNVYVIPRTGSDTATQTIVNTRVVTTSIATQATVAATAGGGISDSATITPASATGTVVFKAYGSDDATCAGVPAYTSPAQTVTAGAASSPTFTPSTVGTYRWIASFTSSSAAFTHATGACNDANETSVVNKTSPTLSTTAKATARLLGAGEAAVIHDAATLTGLTSDAGGTVTFHAYGPNDASCSGTAAFTSTVPLGTVTAGSASPTSASYTPTQAGTYRWTASYGGDAKNNGGSGPCNAPNESSVVDQASTTTTTARATATLPDDAVITDSAQLSGTTTGATGDIVFRLYGPDSTPGTPTCIDAGLGANLVYTSSGFAVNGGGTYGNASYTATRSGTYFWIASYSGDANNAAVSGTCGEASETSVVGKATPTLTTTATGAQLPAGTTISDTADLTGLNPGAGGSVTFTVYGPLDLDAANSCTTVFAMRVVALPTVGAAGTATVPSGAVTVSAAGKYLWVASYSGDADNNGVTGACGDSGETSLVDPASPTLVTTANGAMLPAGTISDRAALTGVTAGAGGTLVFKLWGPSATPDCTGTPVFESAPVTVDGPRSGASSYGPVQTSVGTAGSYYWRAFYSGDADNRAASGACGEAGETSVVAKAQPGLTTSASAVGGDASLPGASIQDSATLTGLSNSPTGDVTFTAYSDAQCANSVATRGPVAIVPGAAGTATAASGAVPVTAAGTYWWIASYSGDANNLPVAGSCGDAGEDVTIAKAQPELATTASDDALPGSIADRHSHPHRTDPGRRRDHHLHGLRRR